MTLTVYKSVISSLLATNKVNQIPWMYVFCSLCLWIEHSLSIYLFIYLYVQVFTLVYFTLNIYVHICICLYIIAFFICKCWYAITYNDRKYIYILAYVCTYYRLRWIRLERILYSFIWYIYTFVSVVFTQNICNIL